jgi:flagellar motility protein MotE (MotC chaperone)
LEDSIVVLQNKIAKLSTEKTNLEVSNSQTEVKTESDEEYKKWVKETSKFYESMESAKAAKIILNYSDNIAKDILYSMKKKKAAEILAEINPEIAKRITRVP